MQGTGGERRRQQVLVDAVLVLVHSRALRMGAGQGVAVDARVVRDVEREAPRLHDGLQLFQLLPLVEDLQFFHEGQRAVFG